MNDSTAKYFLPSVILISHIITDHNDGTNSETAPLFAMSGDGKNDVQIPLVFLFNRQGNQLKEALRETPDGLRIYMGVKPMSMGK